MIKDAEKILSITHKTRRTGREGAQLSQRTVEPQLLVPRGMQRNYRIRRHRPLFNCQNFEMSRWSRSSLSETGFIPMKCKVLFKIQNSALLFNKPPDVRAN